VIIASPQSVRAWLAEIIAVILDLVWLIQDCHFDYTTA
jgi:hypothetical protein